MALRRAPSPQRCPRRPPFLLRRPRGSLARSLSEVSGPAASAARSAALASPTNTRAGRSPKQRPRTGWLSGWLMPGRVALAEKPPPGSASGRLKWRGVCHASPAPIGCAARGVCWGCARPAGGRGGGLGRGSAPGASLPALGRAPPLSRLLREKVQARDGEAAGEGEGGGGAGKGREGRGGGQPGAAGGERNSALERRRARLALRSWKTGCKAIHCPWKPPSPGESFQGGAMHA